MFARKVSYGFTRVMQVLPAGEAGQEFGVFNVLEIYRRSKHIVDSIFVA
jgi:hypothetical protein